MTDLFLVCERLDDSELEAARDHSLARNTPEWALCYPPLAARHLLVSNVDDITLNVQIMKRENFVLQVASLDLKNQLMAEFNAAINAAATCEETYSCNYGPSLNPAPQVNAPNKAVSNELQPNTMTKTLPSVSLPRHRRKSWNSNYQSSTKERV